MFMCHEIYSSSFKLLCACVHASTRAPLHSLAAVRERCFRVRVLMCAFLVNEQNIEDSMKAIGVAKSHEQVVEMVKVIISLRQLLSDMTNH
jgi:hypothetical protein